MQQPYPAAYDAVALLHAEDPELLKQMEDDHRELDARRRDREGKLNDLGVFDASVNEVRARAMYRVEVRRRMHDNVTNTRRNRIGMRDNRAFDPNVYNRKDTLENRLLTLSADIDNIIGDKANERRREKAHKADSAAEDEVGPPCKLHPVDPPIA
jgi:hypothetical protein